MEAQARFRERRRKRPFRALGLGSALLLALLLWAAGSGAQVAASRPEPVAAESDAGAVADGGPADAPPSRAELEESVRRAELAAEQAAAAARAVDEARRRKERMLRRPGFYIGGAFLYGAENFDDSIIVKSSTGGAAIAGYRITELLAAEFRYEGFEGFDLRGERFSGVIDGWAMTASVKLYPLAGSIQPFVALGGGGVRFEEKVVFLDGSRQRADETDGALRFAAGLDLWLTDYVVLNGEVAYLAPVDNLSNLDITVFSTGLTFRF